VNGEKSTEVTSTDMSANDITNKFAENSQSGNDDYNTMYSSSYGVIYTYHITCTMHTITQYTIVDIQRQLYL